MARIKVSDLPDKLKISQAELRRIRGGIFESWLPPDRLRTALGPIPGATLIFRPGFGIGEVKCAQARAGWFNHKCA